MRQYRTKLPNKPSEKPSNFDKTLLRGGFILARRGENIYKRKDGRYEGRYIKGYRDGKKPLFGYVYGYKYKEVKEKLMNCKARQGLVRKVRGVVGDGTTGDFMRYWLEEMTRPNVKISTYGCYFRLVHQHLLPALGHLPLGKLEYAQVQALKQAMEKKNLSETTVHNIFRVLNIILRRAWQDGLLKSNPCDPLSLPNKNEKRRTGFSSEERKRLIQAVCQESEDLQLEVLLPLYTGLRVGELCALRLSDIDLENHILHVRKTLQRINQYDGKKSKTALVLSSPKSQKSCRDIPVPPPLLHLLKKRKASGKPGDFLLGEGGKPMDPRNVQRHFHGLLEKAALRQCGPHTLRHTFATSCLEQGADLATISELLGHATYDMTYHYLHSFSDKKKQLVKRLSKAA